MRSSPVESPTSAFTICLTMSFTHGMKLETLPSRIVVVAVAGFVILAPGLGAQTHPCLAVTPPADEQVAILKSVLTSRDEENIACARGMGLGGVKAADIVVETDSVKCTAVTNAVLSGSPLHASSLLIIRAGKRYVALDPSEASPWVVTSLSRKFGDIRVSGVDQ